MDSEANTPLTLERLKAALETLCKHSVIPIPFSSKMNGVGFAPYCVNEVSPLSISVTLSPQSSHPWSFTAFAKFPRKQLGLPPNLSQKTNFSDSNFVLRKLLRLILFFTLILKTRNSPNLKINTTSPRKDGCTNFLSYINLDQ